MAIRIAVRMRVAAMTCGTLFSFPIVVGHAQSSLPVSEVKVTVVDQTGALIIDSEVAFQTDSKTIVSHVGNNGWATVTLPGGQYVVTASHLGFLKNTVPDFQVSAPKAAALQVVLQVGRAEICTLPCGGDGLLPLLELTTSDLPNFIPPEPIHESSSPPAATTQAVAQQTAPRKIRSWHCLYLWRCSAS